MVNIKVNLPASLDDWKTASGEGVWVLVEQDAKDAYDSDEVGTVYEAIMDNDSVYFPGLCAGDKVPIEMRGSWRPTVPYSWLLQKFGPGF